MDRPVKMIAAIQGASSTEAQEVARASRAGNRRPASPASSRKATACRTAPAAPAGCRASSVASPIRSFRILAKAPAPASRRRRRRDGKRSGAAGYRCRMRTGRAQQIWQARGCGRGTKRGIRQRDRGGNARAHRGLAESRTHGIASPHRSMSRCLPTKRCSMSGGWRCGATLRCCAMANRTSWRRRTEPRPDG